MPGNIFSKMFHLTLDIRVKIYYRIASQNKISKGHVK